ncbi:MAG: FN3 associated domain-containing protein [Cellulosilyticaceae bacterium]
MKRQGLVNIYHFIRKSTYEDGIFTQEDFDTLRLEMELLKQHQLPATYALKYDALMDARYTALIKSMIDEKDEVGAWWEVTEEMAQKAGVTWKGKDVIDLNVKAGYSLAYLPDERKALLDVYMKDFKKVYGDYPKTIGSWVMDIVTFEYAKERYGVIGGALCRDQIGIDGFTLWGGYFNGAYYPSKVNEYMPAQTKEMQLDLPIFRLLGPDPIYNFESGIREGAEGIYTLEPAWVTGQDEKWVSWLFSCITDEEQLGYGYTQVGQENSYIWGTMGDAFEMQIRQLATLRRENKVRVESLRDSSQWFASKYKLTPPTTYTASKDWNKAFNLNTSWYSSRFYRMSVLWDQGELAIRDLYVFNESYPSRYLNDFITHNESVFDALPILDGHRWSTDNQRAMIQIKDCESGALLRGDKPRFMAGENEQDWYTNWQIEDGRELSILCTQDQVRLEMLQEADGYRDWMLTMNTLPVLKGCEKERIVCEHEGFSYEVKLLKGYFEQVGNMIHIIPTDDQIVLAMAQKEHSLETGFYTETYLEEAEAFDQKTTEQVVIDQEKLKKVKLIKPVLSHHAYVKQYGEVCCCEMSNPNDEGQIHYTLDGTEPTEQSKVYTEAVVIREDTKVSARCLSAGRSASDVALATYHHTLPIHGIMSQTQFDERKVFNRQGVLDLIDGKKGTTNFADGAWLGTQESLDVTIDLGKVKSIKGIEVGFLQSRRTGLCYPEYVACSVSCDGQSYEEVGREEVHAISGDPDMEAKDVVVQCDCEARYVHIFAKRYNYFLFTDQIVIKG